MFYDTQISCSLQYSSPPSLVHRQWYHIVLLINSIQVVMVVFMTTPRDRFIKVISKKSSVKTLFCNDDGCLTHIVQPSSKSPSCSSSSASHSTTSSPSRVSPLALPTTVRCRRLRIVCNSGRRCRGWYRWMIIRCSNIRIIRCSIQQNQNWGMTQSLYYSRREVGWE